MHSFMMLAQAAQAQTPREKDFGDWIHKEGIPFLGRDIGLGLEVWHPIGLVVLILLGILANAATRLLARAVAKVILARGGASARVEYIAFAARPLGAMAMGFLWYALLPLLNLNDVVELVTLDAIHLVLIVAGIWSCFRLIDLAGEVMAARAAQTENKLDDVLVPLLRKGAKILAFVLGFTVGLVTLTSADVGQMFTSITIGGVALGFAAKETVENFFGTVTVILDRPFDIGDAVIIDGKVEGTVEELGFRSTRVRTPQDTLITVPNATLVRANVENFQRRNFRRWKTTLSLVCATPPEKILAFTEGVRELVRLHPYTRKDLYQVYAYEFGVSSLDVLMVVFFAVPDGHTELRERERLFLDIVRLADRLGVSFAFPTRTLVMQQSASVGDPEPLPLPSGPHDAGAQMAGVGAAHDITRGQPWRDHRPEPYVPPQAVTDYSASGDGPDKA